MRTTNMSITENPTVGSQKLPLIRKYVASMITGVRNRETDNLPVTARGRALYTIDCFMNGKTVLPKHDGLSVTLRRAFAH